MSKFVSFVLLVNSQAREALILAGQWRSQNCGLVGSTSRNLIETIHTLFLDMQVPLKFYCCSYWLLPYKLHTIFYLTYINTPFYSFLLLMPYTIFHHMCLAIFHHMYLAKLLLFIPFSTKGWAFSPFYVYQTFSRYCCYFLYSQCFYLLLLCILLGNLSLIFLLICSRQRGISYFYQILFLLSNFKQDLKSKPTLVLSQIPKSALTIETMLLKTYSRWLRDEFVAYTPRDCSLDTVINLRSNLWFEPFY